MVCGRCKGMEPLPQPETRLLTGQGSEIVLTDEVECFWLSGASADRGLLLPEPHRSPSQACTYLLTAPYPLSREAWPSGRTSVLGGGQDALPDSSVAALACRCTRRLCPV